jgi:hypothetical protein
MKIIINDWPLGHQEIEINVTKFSADKHSAYIETADGSYPFTNESLATGTQILSSDIFWYKSRVCQLEQIIETENDAAWLAAANE